MATKNYYTVLGISRTENASGIRNAFRELAKRYHPDFAGPQGTTFFQDILEAYRVLSDPQQRRLYNQGLRHAEGEEELPPEPIMTDQGLEPEPLTPEPLSFDAFHAFRPSREELLGRLQRNFTSRGVPRGERLEGLHMELILSPEEAIRGGIMHIHAPVFYPCSACGGSGRDWLFPCRYCQGQGLIEEEEIVRAHIPAFVRDGTILELPLRGLGVHNFYLRIHIRLAV